MPLLFPPLFPDSDSQKVLAPCPASVGFYGVNHAEGTVTSLSLCPSLKVNKQITVRSHPLQLAVTPDGSTLLVTSYDNAVNFIDTATDAVTFTLNTPGLYPSGIAISPDGTRAYVTNYFTNPSLLVIDIPNRKLLSTIPLATAFPRVVVLTPDGTQAWVNYYQGNTVTIVDTLTGLLSHTMNLGTSVSMGMAFNPTGTKAFIAGPNNVIVVDTATLAILARVTTGNQPTDVVVTPDGRSVLVNSSTQAGLWRIDAIHNTLAAIPDPASPVSRHSMGMLLYP
jgi:YVTN family beta-propeller protein